MKRTILLILLVCLSIIFLSACSDDVSKIDRIELEIGNSVRFTQKEIMNAVHDVIKTFNADFSGCTLTHLWYDEEKSEAILNSYITTGRGSVNGIDRENVIVLLSNFEVGSSGHCQSLESNNTYKNWNWILIRDTKNGTWRVDDKGF